MKPASSTPTTRTAGGSRRYPVLRRKPSRIPLEGGFAAAALGQFQYVYTAGVSSSPDIEAQPKVLQLQVGAAEISKGLAAGGALWRKVMLPGSQPVDQRLYEYRMRLRYAQIYSCARAQATSPQ